MGGHRGRRLALALLLALLLFLPARQAMAGDDFLPDPPGGMVTWAQDPLYDRYPVWHYTYGSRLAGAADTIHRLTYVMNLVQVAKAWVLKLALRSVEYALHLDLVTPMLTKATAGMRALGEFFWQKDGAPYVLGGLIAAGALALGAGALGGRRRGLKVAGGAALVLLTGYAVLEVASAALSGSATVARQVGAQVMSAGALVAAPAGSEGTAPERLMRAAGESAWRIFVLAPWLEGEFTAGAADREMYKEGDVPGGQWLALTPYQRLQRYNANPAAQIQDLHQWDSGLAMDYVPRRMTLALVSALAGLIYAGALLLLAGAVLYYQILLLAILVLAPLWLLLALWHPAGLRIVRGAVVKAMGALVAQVVLLTVLTANLVLAIPLAGVGRPMGWLVQSLLLAMLGAVLYRYRFRWLHWGREESREADRETRVSWVERVLTARRREPAGGAAPGREAAVASAGPLPQFRVERPAEPQAVPVERGAAEATASAELASELRRLRSRLQRAEAGSVMESGAAREPRLVQEAVVGRGAAGKTAGPAPVAEAPAGVRRRADQGQALNQYRSR